MSEPTKILSSGQVLFFHEVSDLYHCEPPAGIDPAYMLCLQKPTEPGKPAVVVPWQQISAKIDGRTRLTHWIPGAKTAGAAVVLSASPEELDPVVEEAS